MTGADVLAASLRAHGVEWISTLCGHGLNSIYAACRRAGIRLIDTRNEQTAAYMAECWGRLSGQVGVCAVSSGVAHVNALTGVANAHFDGAPMLLLSGAGPRRTAGLGHFQDMDQVAAARPLCKYAQAVESVERIPGMVAEAFAVALSGRPGPAHLTVPMDVQDAEVGEAAAAVAPPALPSRRHPAPHELVHRAAEMFGAARRPLLVAGSGAFYAGAGESMEGFAAAFAVPFAVPIWDRSCAVEARPEFMGVVGAASGGPRLLADADLVVLLGAEPDYRVGYLRAPALADGCRTIRVDAAPERLGQGPTPDLAIHADPASFLGQLGDECTERGLDGYEEWLGEAVARRDRFRAELVAGVDRQRGLHALDVVEAVAAVAPPEAVLVVDGGNIGQWFHQTLGRTRYSGLVLTCGASGVVGFGVAGA
ncbi:MAG: thiamine pyrophosphate-binding protein, partial [Gemmatimonadota bacterium]